MKKRTSSFWPNMYLLLNQFILKIDSHFSKLVDTVQIIWTSNSSAGIQKNSKYEMALTNHITSFFTAIARCYPLLSVC